MTNDEWPEPYEQNLGSLFHTQSGRTPAECFLLFQVRLLASPSDGTVMPPALERSPGNTHKVRSKQTTMKLSVITWDEDGSVVYTEQPVVICAVQQFVQLVESSAGGVPWQKGCLLWQIANQLQGNALWEVPRPDEEIKENHYKPFSSAEVW